MTNETKDNGEAFGLPSTKQKPHPYSQVLQWVAEGKDIEAFTGAQWITAVTCGILNAANHFGHPEYYQPQDFRLKPERHIHQDLIDAYAKGAEIQFFTCSGKWEDREVPLWCETAQYRIKPEHKPDVIRYIHITKERSVDIATYFPSAWVGAVLEVTLDGETGEIKYSKKYQGDYND